MREPCYLVIVTTETSASGWPGGGPSRFWRELPPAVGAAGLRTGSYSWPCSSPACSEDFLRKFAALSLRGPLSRRGRGLSTSMLVKPPQRVVGAV